MKRIIIFSVAGILALCTLAAEPTVTDVVAKQRYPWNGLVDITCKVSGIDGTTNGLYFAVAAVESGATNNVSSLWVVQNGTKTTNREAHTNGNYRLLWNARADLGAVIYSNMVVRVTFDSHDRVQLWEGGPCWATTNIGAEEPWEFGYYFWWGDTVGYKRENDAWVATDGSSSNFQFYSDPISKQTDKAVDALVSEGWVVSKGGTYVLASEHDAAQVQWGSGWRMPTSRELSDLNNNCDWTLTTQNGVNGYEVRGRDNYASNSIFLPCAGFGWCDSFGLSSSYYWSSVPENYWNESDASSLFFNDDYDYDNYHGHLVYFCERHTGVPVRPVQGGGNP